MHKIIHPCDMKFYNGRHYPIFCKVEIEDGKLSITGVIGPTVGGNAMGSCGQIDMEFKHRNPEHDDKRWTDPTPVTDLRFAPGWDAEKWYTFLEVWHDWHLNDMRSACEHQRALGWKYDEHHGAVVVRELMVTRQGETEVSERYDEFKGHACPVCGYSIGSAWLKEELPGQVVEFLNALPYTDRHPNWV